MKSGMGGGNNRSEESKQRTKNNSTEAVNMKHL